MIVLRKSTDRMSRQGCAWPKIEEMKTIRTTRIHMRLTVAGDYRLTGTLTGTATSRRGLPTTWRYFASKLRTVSALSLITWVVEPKGWRKQSNANTVRKTQNQESTFIQRYLETPSHDRCLNRSR